MNLTMERVHQHDQKLYELEVELVQLRSSLVSLTYDFDYNVVINYLLSGSTCSSSTALLATHSGVGSTLQVLVLAVTLKLLVCLEVRDRIVD